MNKTNEKEQTNIVLPLMTVTKSGKEVPILLNHEYCYDILKDMYFSFAKPLFNDDCFIDSLEIMLLIAKHRLRRSLFEMAADKYAFPKEMFSTEFGMPDSRIYKQGKQTLALVSVPLDACLKEGDCNMIGFYTDGTQLKMYTSEYCCLTKKFGLCCFQKPESSTSESCELSFEQDEDEESLFKQYDVEPMHLSFSQDIESLDDFREKIIELNTEHKA